ncbi:hypothetical protein SteCoe_8647 [Stentor coeruleus]|uniref:Cyclic nucleotide-binding domain-containing protein n=1 Tax=Stentor coeruleus TaxID=5963 RepID=A0A1R2CJQ2_9CILI|nr:hypothetical protein SteCoe_8647 [Stentor coeruleus]
MDAVLSLLSLKLIKTKNSSSNDICLSTLIRYLKISPSQRKAREINMIKVFTNKVSFFTTGPSENLESIHYQSCQSMKYEFLPKDNIVFKFGDMGNKFYIILDGKVDVQVPSNSEDPLEFTSVATLGSGNAFGDLALIKDHPRNATVTCLTDCHMAVLIKEDYLRILGKIAEKKITDFVEFLKEIPIFQSWYKKNLESLYYYFKIQVYNRKNVIYSIGSYPTHVYIVKSGEFEISKKVVLVGDQQKIDMKVAILTKGEMFGDSEVIEEIPREYNCTCYSTTGELYAISIKDFILKVKTEESISLINVKNKTKSILRNMRTKALEEIFTPQTPVGRSFSKPEKTVKLEKKIYASFFREKNEHKRINHLELRKIDIKTIKARALPEKTGRDFITLNTPLEFTYRMSPSGRLKGSCSVKKTRKMNNFSLLNH